MQSTSNSLELILLNVGYSELNANWNWKGIYSPFVRIYYVTGGQAKTRIGNDVYLLEPGHLYLTPPFTLHDDECDSFFSLFYIHFYEKSINKESIFDKYEFPIAIKTDSLDMALTERLLLINPDRDLRHFDPKLYDNPPTFSEYIAKNNKMEIHSIIETQGIIYQLVSRFFKTAKIKSNNKDFRVNKGLQFIHENIDKNITVSQLADIACITEDHFIRIFRHEMNCTPLKYINLKKIEKAQLLLLTTDIPIKDVAFELSIDTVSYFSRIFKKHTGKTPGEYRNEYNK